MPAHVARVLLLAAAHALTASAAGTFSFAALFGNGMTLQSAPDAARVWGWADAGATVAVWQRSFNKSGGAWGRPALASTVVSHAADGLWVAELPPTLAGGPYRLEFYATSAAGASIANATLDWLWFGDVILYSGQSNMGFQAQGVLGPRNESAWEMAQYLNDNFYGARALQLPQGVVASSPQAQISTHGWQLGWAAFSNTSLGEFSAVGAFTTAGFLDVAGFFNNHSAGAIESSWGGTTINIWMPSAAVAQCPTPFAQVSPTIDEGPSTPTSIDSVAYNAMIAPLTVGPLAIKGIVWLQGESDADIVHGGGPEYYACALPALISSWRAAFAAPDLFFGIMQLAAYPAENNTALAEIRDVQLNTTLATPHTAIASATDLGDLYSPQGSIHPRYKVVNSRRMAAAAAGVIYGVAGPPRGPTYASAVALGAGTDLAVSISFEPGTADGLVLLPPVVPYDPVRLPAFNVAWPAVLASDGVWRNATWRIGANGTFVLAAPAPAGATAVATQYAFGNWPVNLIANSVGLPGMPWRRWL